MQGVSINLFIKTGTNNPRKLAEVYHYDMFGKSLEKYEQLSSNTFTSLKWTELNIQSPDYYFIPQDLETLKSYQSGVSVTEIFTHYNSGIQTKRDAFTIHYNLTDLNQATNDLLNNDLKNTRAKYNIAPDGRDWQINLAKEDLKGGFKVIKVLHRPFDDRYTAYTGKSKGFIAYPRGTTSVHYIDNDNVGLITCRQTKSNPGAFISKNPIDQKSFSAYDINSMFPLYLYPEPNDLEGPKIVTERIPNLNQKAIKEFSNKLGLTFTNEKEDSSDTFAPIDILYYIYAILHSPKYINKYKDFLKIDFPRVPYPKNPEVFWQLVKLGGKIRQNHLLECPTVEEYITQYPIDGDNVVTTFKYLKGRVFINETQYFDNVPEVAWNLYVGGYQPAQKWLKDRKERKLEFEDILHYQRMIVALKETDRLMSEIDKIGFEGEQINIKKEVTEA